MRTWFSSFPRPYRKKQLIKLLGASTLHIIDVGASGGIHPRWRVLKQQCKVTTFDPDPRAKVDAQTIPYGLWSHEEHRKLHLAHFPDASSLYPFHPNLYRFSNAACHRNVGSKTVTLKTLDQLKLKGDVLKIDAEGAELAILKGGADVVRACFAVELEVSFLERYQDAPLFNEVDAYMRSQGFELQQLQRHHWIRKNNFHPLYASPQLVWGNALYIRKREALLKHDLRKVLTTLLLYNCHDTALDLCSTDELQHAVKATCCSSTLYVSKLVVSLLLGTSGILCCALFPKLRLKFVEYTRERLRILGQILLSFSRGGPEKCSVYDAA